MLLAKATLSIMPWVIWKWPIIGKDVLIKNVVSPCHKIAYKVIREGSSLKGNVFCFPKRGWKTAAPLIFWRS